MNKKLESRTLFELDASVRGASVENLNHLLADTMTLRDLYQKHHWQVGRRSTSST